MKQKLTLLLFLLASCAVGTNSFNLNIAPQVTPVVVPIGAITATNVGMTFSLTVPPVTLTPSGFTSATYAASINYKYFSGFRLY